MDNLENETIEIEFDGKKIKCDVLFTFVSEDTGKGYIGYTDNHLEKNGKPRIIVSAYDPYFGEADKLEAITDPDEIKMVKDVVKSFAN